MEQQKAFEPTTKGGYQLDEVTSALQKCIRRGKERLALFFAYEMADSGYTDYMWRRLMVIASEDIGVADNFAPVLVNALFQNGRHVLGQKKKDDPLKEYLQIAHAVLYLCRTPKTRYVDNFGCYVSERRKQGWRPRVPDAALDCHTKQGRRMGRSVLDFCSEGSKLENEVMVDGPDYRSLECTVCKTLGKCELGLSRVEKLKKEKEDGAQG